MWPTWADILIRDLGVESYNYGFCGLGNVGIMHEIVRADRTHKFTKDDAIFIVWSSWAREDRWVNGFWGPFGSIFFCDFYGKQFIKKYCDPENDVIKNATAIISTNKMYGDIIKFQGHMIDPTDQVSHLIGRGVNHDAVQELYDFYSDGIPISNVFNHKRQYSYDGHPSIIDHIDYIEENVSPAIDSTLKKETVEYYKALDDRIRHLPRKSVNNWGKMSKMVESLISEDEK